MEEDDQNIPAREIFVLVKTKERVEDMFQTIVRPLEIRHKLVLL